MRSKNIGHEENYSGNNGNQNQGGGKNKKKDRNRNNQKPEPAKVVTPERAVELGSVISKIAASTVAAHEAAGEPSPIVAPTSVIGDTPARDSDKNLTDKQTDKLLEAVLDALPEPKAPGQGRRKPRRATSSSAAATSVEQQN
jgi:ribonuclease E